MWIIEFIIDSFFCLTEWRFHIRFWPCVALAFLLATSIPHEPTNLIAAGAAVITGFVWGMRAK